jgi:hypothetical protein
LVGFFVIGFSCNATHWRRSWGVGLCDAQRR